MTLYFRITPDMRNWPRWGELGLGFVILPGLLALGPRWLLLPSIFLSGLVCLVWLLRDPSFPRRNLVRKDGLGVALRWIVIRAVVLCSVLLVICLMLDKTKNLFFLPRTHPRIWAAIFCLYPVFSAFPQEIVYRAFFFHRYGHLFRTPVEAIAVNAVLFGWAHVAVHTGIAVVLAAAGGVLFARTYIRSRSALLAGVEHAIYGDFVFTAGIGGMFVNGVRLMSRLGG